MNGSQSDDISGLEEFVEDVGVVAEAAGLPRAAGRVLGWLLICDPPEQSASELAAALRASAGGVSTSTRLLTQHRLIERTARHGDRKSYYRVAPGMWGTVMAGQHADLIRFRTLGQRGLQLLAHAPAARRARLAEMADFYAFMEREMPILLRRFHEEREGTA